jgi:predicted SnoaL-like aldol condensation-catalyzing enzyme
MDKQQQPFTNTSKEEDEAKNIALAIRYHDDIFQKGKLDVADEILSPDFVIHNPILPENLYQLAYVF